MNRLLILLGVFMLPGLCASAQPADSLRRGCRYGAGQHAPRRRRERYGSRSGGLRNHARAGAAPRFVAEIPLAFAGQGAAVRRDRDGFQSPHGCRLCGLSCRDGGFSRFAGWQFVPLRRDAHRAGGASGQTGKIRVCDRSALYGQQLPPFGQHDHAGP